MVTLAALWLAESRRCSPTASRLTVPPPWAQLLAHPGQQDWGPASLQIRGPGVMAISSSSSQANLRRDQRQCPLSQWLGQQRPALGTPTQNGDNLEKGKEGGHYRLLTKQENKSEKH